MRLLGILCTHFSLTLDVCVSVVCARNMANETTSETVCAVSTILLHPLFGFFVTEPALLLIFRYVSVPHIAVAAVAAATAHICENEVAHNRMYFL